MVDTLSPAGFAEVRRAEAGQGQGDCQAGPGREEHVWAWLSASACLCASHGASWMRVALARPSGSVLMSGGRGRGAHRGVRYSTSSIVSITGAVSGAMKRDVTIEGVFSHPGFRPIRAQNITKCIHGGAHGVSIFTAPTTGKGCFW